MIIVLEREIPPRQWTRTHPLLSNALSKQSRI